MRPKFIHWLANLANRMGHRGAEKGTTAKRESRDGLGAWWRKPLGAGEEPQEISIKPSTSQKGGVEDCIALLEALQQRAEGHNPFAQPVNIYSVEPEETEESPPEELAHNDNKQEPSLTEIQAAAIGLAKDYFDEEEAARA